MKAALDEFLESDRPDADVGEDDMDMSSIGAMFDEGEAADPLIDALSSVGYPDVDEEKLQRIRAILDEGPAEGGDMGGMPGDDAGVAPAGME